jgi:uncharacterized membrane protein
MNKQEFLAQLEAKLSGLPHAEVQERLDFYSEMLDDRIEEGLPEAEAVASLGSIDDIASQIISDIPLSRLAKERIKPKRRMQVWEIILLAVGSPIWLSLAVVAFAVVISLYAVLWSLIAALWAVFASFAACSVGGVTAGTVFAIFENVPLGLALIGAAITLAGVSIFLFIGSVSATKGTAILTKRIALGIKKCFIKKEEA